MTKRILIIGHVWPEPKSSAAGSRMMQLIEHFQLQHHKLTFVSACAKTDNAFDLSTLGITNRTIALNNSSFDEFIKDLNPEIVLFDRFMTEEQFGWRVAEQCPNALRILDTEDLHCLRSGRQQAFKEKQAFDMSFLLNEKAKREIASIYRCDLSLIISEAEMHILKHQFKIDESLLMYLPFLMERLSKEQVENLPSFDNRAHFMTIGNFLHAPNDDAVLYLKSHIWPLIRSKLPEAELHIYGAYASQKVHQLHNEKERFMVKGFAPDVHVVMQMAKVCLAPLSFGAGLKGKLVDAMQNGTPCMMSSIASEGMFGALEPNGFVGDDPEDFANNAVNLYNKRVLWEEKQQNGFDIINQRFSKDDFGKKLTSKIEELGLQLQKHRTQNFIGQLLQHHTMQSTKYLSKWIEEKQHRNPK